MSTFIILLTFIHISSHFLMLADGLFRPAQIQNCIVLTLVSPVLQSVEHSATLLRGAQDRQVMEFPIIITFDEISH